LIEEIDGVEYFVASRMFEKAASGLRIFNYCPAMMINSEEIDLMFAFCLTNFEIQRPCTKIVVDVIQSRKFASYS
jgi:hypothetical protein